MQFDECFEGDYRIFVGALDAPRGEGFIAAVVVSRLLGDDAGNGGNARGGDTASLRGVGDGGPAGGCGTAAAQARRAREVWRDDSLACGYRWPTPEAALHYAKKRAREMVRSDSPILAAAASSAA